MTAPTVSIITATYNGAGLVGATIASVLAQSFADFEMVIVDDCSTDATRAVLATFDDPRIRVIHAPANRGPVHTRNHAIAEARGRYIAGLDQDDLCRPDRLARQVAYLDTHPDVVLVATAADLLIDGRLRPSVQPGETTPELIDWYLQVLNPLVWSATMFRADAARRLDPVTRPEILYAEDFDFYHRIRAFGRIARIDEPLMLYRKHAGGVSQRFESILVASATRVLAEVHGALFATRSNEAAAALVRHVMLREPVSDAATLARLFADVLAIRDDFMLRRSPDAATRATIDREVARLWWSLCRAGVRSGRLSLRDIWAAQPADLVDKGDHVDLALSRAIGAVRALRRASRHG